MGFWIDKRVCVTGRKLDVTRVREHFRFEAEVTCAEGIKRTVEWWEANRDGYDERVGALAEFPV